MTNEQKNEIVFEANRYCKEKLLSQNQLAQLSGINPSYLSSMMAGKFEITSGNKLVAIKDSWFERLASFIGYNTGKVYWGLINTDEFAQIIMALDHAKETGTTATIIAPTGTGKTYAVDKFVNKHPGNTYRITVSQLYDTKDIVAELMEKLSLPVIGSKANRVLKIQLKLRELKVNGSNPIIILDEAENLRVPVLRMLKALYDGIKNHASIVLIGTNQLTEKLDKMEMQDREGIPQFCRRFKAGRKFITVSEKGFAPFFDQLKITDTGLRKLLNTIARNYGELNDYLETALREADRRNLPLTENLFRLIYNIPKL